MFTHPSLHLSQPLTANISSQNTRALASPLPPLSGQGFGSLSPPPDHFHILLNHFQSWLTLSQRRRRPQARESQDLVVVNTIYCNLDGSTMGVRTYECTSVFPIGLGFKDGALRSALSPLRPGFVSRTGSQPSGRRRAFTAKISVAPLANSARHAVPEALLPVCSPCSLTMRAAVGTTQTCVIQSKHRRSGHALEPTMQHPHTRYQHWPWIQQNHRQHTPSPRLT